MAAAGIAEKVHKKVGKITKMMSMEARGARACVAKEVTLKFTSRPAQTPKNCM